MAADAVALGSPSLMFDASPDKEPRGETTNQLATVAKWLKVVAKCSHDNKLFREGGLVTPIMLKTFAHFESTTSVRTTGR